MRSRSTRLGTVAVGLLALTASVVPPAEAHMVLHVVFTGTIVLNGPLGYPCVGPGNIPGGWTIDLALCPPVTTTPTPVTDLPLPPGAETITNSHLDWRHNTRGINLASNTCFDIGVNILKPKPAGQAGFCSFGTVAGPLPNTISGYCGLSGGYVTLQIVDDLGQPITLELHFDIIDLTIAYSGHWQKVMPSSFRHGLVAGLGAVVPPVPTLTPGSCLGKTATTFTIVGKLTFISDPLL